MIAPDLVGFGAQRQAQRAARPQLRPPRRVDAPSCSSTSSTSATSPSSARTGAGSSGSAWSPPSPTATPGWPSATPACPPVTARPATPSWPGRSSPRTTEDFPVGAIVDGGCADHPHPGGGGRLRRPLPRRHLQGRAADHARPRPDQPDDPASADNVAAWEVLERFDQPVPPGLQRPGPGHQAAAMPRSGPRCPGPRASPTSPSRGPTTSSRRTRGPELGRVLVDFIAATLRDRLGRPEPPGRPGLAPAGGLDLLGPGGHRALRRPRRARRRRLLHRHPGRRRSAAGGDAAVTAAFGSIHPDFVAACLDLCRTHTTFEAAAAARDARGGRRACAPTSRRSATAWRPWRRTCGPRPTRCRSPVGCSSPSRRARPRPDDPLLSAWLAVNCIREWRGDTHWAIHAADGLDGDVAGVLDGAWRGYDGHWLPRSRGTDDAALAAALARLEATGLATDGDVDHGRASPTARSSRTASTGSGRAGLAAPGRGAHRRLPRPGRAGGRPPGGPHRRDRRAPAGCPPPAIDRRSRRDRGRRTRTIARPPEEVWAVLADFGAIADWADNVDHSCLLGAGRRPDRGHRPRPAASRPGASPCVEESSLGRAGGAGLRHRGPAQGRRAGHATSGASSPPATRTRATLTTRVDCGPRPPQQLRRPHRRPPPGQGVRHHARRPGPHPRRRRRRPCLIAPTSSSS